MSFASRAMQSGSAGFTVNVASVSSLVGARTWQSPFGSFSPATPYYKGNAVVGVIGDAGFNELWLYLQTPPVNAAGGTPAPVDSFEKFIYDGVVFLRSDALAGLASNATWGDIRTFRWLTSAFPLSGARQAYLLG